MNKTLVDTEMIYDLSGGYSWHMDTDEVINKEGKAVGAMANCMTDIFSGTLFYVRTSTGETGIGAFPSKYSIDGANGFLNCKDYVLWTGRRLVHIPANEAIGSVVKNNGEYSKDSGVNGMMSSADKAYLNDLVKEYWGSNADGSITMNKLAKDIQKKLASLPYLYITGEGGTQYRGTIKVINGKPIYEYEEVIYEEEVWEEDINE